MQKFKKNIKPLLYLVILNALGVLILTIQENSAANDVAMLGSIVCGVAVVSYIIVSMCRLGDPYLLVIVSVLGSIGVIMQCGIDSDLGLSHIKLYLIGVVAFYIAMIAYRIMNKYLSRMTLFYIGISVSLFVATLLFGSSINGAKNWLFGIQPSEFIRILFVLAMAAVFTNGRKKELKANSRLINTHSVNHIERLKMTYMRIFVGVGVVGLHAFFLLLQREWGTLLLFMMLYLVFIYVYGDSKLFFFANVVVVGIAIVIACSNVEILPSHIQTRFNAWENPFADEIYYDDGFQMAQSMFAISGGGFAGQGIGAGYYTYIGSYLDAVENDFIFAGICEEMGVLGGAGVLMLYFMLVYRGFKIALSSTNEFNKAVSLGLSAILGIQTFITVGGVTKLIPHTGITLPFISQGGSSMISTFMIIGILQAISAVKGEVTDEVE